MYFKQMSLAVLCGMLALTAGDVNAALLASDDFGYPDGSLVPNGGWANHSGTDLDLLVASGAAVVQHGTPSEDANLGFADVSSGVLNATFDIVVNADAVIGGGDYEYFAHFFTDGSFNFRSRLDVLEGSSGGDYTLGISSTSSTAEATLPVDFSFGDVVAVSLDFDLDSGIGSVTVGGDTIVGTSDSLGETLNRFALRQSDSSNNETVTVDNLRISGTADPIPEPASIVLMCAGLMGVAAARRR